MKKGLIILMSISLIICIVILDYVCSRFLETKPFVSYVKKTENSKIYNSIIYKVFYCEQSDGSYMRYFKYRTESFTCPTVKNNTTDYTIVDDVEICSQVYEIFYEDENYICAYDCLKSDNVFLVYEDGTKISVKQAVQNNVEPIEDLILKGVPCTRKIEE